MTRQKQLINEADWDILIILDACRYDIFREVNYLDGDLKKVESEGSSTVEWLTKTFTNSYPYTYISANPYVNSKDVGKFEATKFFSDIKDAWLEAWDNDKETVWPSDLVNFILNQRFDKPAIIHFMQPHTPYLTAECSFSFKNVVKRHSSEEKERFKIREELGKAFSWVLGKERTKHLSGVLFGGMKNKESSFEKQVREWGIPKTIEEYKKSLKIVLSEVEQLLAELDGKIVVTSDHGEAFGEGGVLGHPGNSDLKVLREVPWLEVEV